MFVETAPQTSSVRDTRTPKQRELERLADRIAKGAAELAAATARWLELVAEFDRREGYTYFGFHRCSIWLAWRCAITPRAAREQVRVARSLDELPKVAEAFRAGRLTYSKVRAITRVATAENEELLLKYATYATAAQLERIVRGYRGCLGREEAERQAQRRRVDYRWELDGSLSFRGRLTAEEGALFLKALEAGRDACRPGLALDTDSSDHHKAREANVADPAPVTNADALVAIASSSLESSPRGGSSADRFQVVVTTDVAALGAAAPEAGTKPQMAEQSDAEPPTRCRLDSGSPLSPEALRRIACDASLVRINLAEGMPVSVGRKTRSIPPATRRALRERDGGCRFPGCTAERFAEGHHIKHWSRGGATDLGNLVQLCSRHHRLVHERGFTVEGDPHHELVFRDPRGRAIPQVPGLPGGEKGAVQRENRRLGLEIGPRTCDSLGHGERFDLGMAVQALLTEDAVGPSG